MLRIGVHVQVTDAVLADAVEAMFGAVFCDGGFEAVRAAILRIFSERVSRLSAEGLRKDAKSELQELLQSRGQKPPQYEVVGKQGEGHRLKWQVKCRVAASGLESAGTGSSLQRAQQEAARAMLELLK